jgi:hypothetical protein
VRPLLLFLVTPALICSLEGGALVGRTRADCRAHSRACAPHNHRDSMAPAGGLARQADAPAAGHSQDQGVHRLFPDSRLTRYLPSCSFEASHLSGAIPLNHRNPSLQQLEPLRGSHIVLIGPRGRQTSEVAQTLPLLLFVTLLSMQFANTLVRQGFPYVSQLEGGHEALLAALPPTEFRAGPAAGT